MCCVPAVVFCPNSNCIHHSKGYVSERCFIKKGKKRRKDGTLIQRYQCKSCSRTFRKSVFSLNYCNKLHGAHINVRIFKAVIHNHSNRSIARELNVSECCVRGRIRKLFKVGLVRHHNFIDKFKIKEPVVYDGLECFARSQYEPNNINQAVGAESLFCYLFNYAPLNRKGRVSHRQRSYLEKLELIEGRFNPRAIRETSVDLFRHLLSMTDASKVLHLKSDEHFQYRRAIERDLGFEEQSRIVHETVSSKACRNYKNILFSVNHFDLLIRRYVAAFTRETICFSKTARAMYEKYVLFACYKNYMKPKFVKRQKKDRNSNKNSPAMALKLCTKVLEFSEYFRVEPQSTVLPLDWQAMIDGAVTYRRSKKYLKAS